MCDMAEESDFSELPVPVWESIVTFLDIQSLAACCCVCREWNLLLSTDEKFWKEACQFSGLKLTPEIFPDDCGNWNEYALLIMKRSKQMRRSECFRKSGFIIDSAEEEAVTAIYYYKNKLAVALRTKIEMWSTTSPEALLFEVDFGMFQRLITSVRFDDLYIMYTDSLGRMKSIDVLSREQRRWYGDQHMILVSYDFHSAINIVIGSYMDSCIYIWELSTGTLLKKIQPGMSIMKVKMVLIRQPECHKTGIIDLFGMNVGRLLKWIITFDNFLSRDRIDCSGTPFVIYLKPSGESSRTLFPKCTLLSREGFLYYPTLPHVRCETIGELDLHSLCTRKMRQKEKIKNLLAVGGKYIAFHAAGERGVSEKVRVIEISSNKLMATYEVPHDIDRSIGNPDNDALVFGDRDWLDGLDLTNDRGVLLAYIRNDKKVCFVNWIPRHEYAR